MTNNMMKDIRSVNLTKKNDLIYRNIETANFEFKEKNIYFEK